MVRVLYNTRTLKRRVKREPLSLMNERLIWSLPTSTNILYKERGGRQRGGGKERAVPTSTVGLELSQTQYSLSVELISHVEPTTRGRETAGQDKTVVRWQRWAKGNTRPQGYPLDIGETFYFFVICQNSFDILKQLNQSVDQPAFGVVL